MSGASTPSGVCDGVCVHSRPFEEVCNDCDLLVASGLHATTTYNRLTAAERVAKASQVCMTPVPLLAEGGSLIVIHEASANWELLPQWSKDGEFAYRLMGPKDPTSRPLTHNRVQALRLLQADAKKLAEIRGEQWPSAEELRAEREYNDSFHRQCVECSHVFNSFKRKTCPMCFSQATEVLG